MTPQEAAALRHEDTEVIAAPGLRRRLEPMFRHRSNAIATAALAACLAYPAVRFVGWALVHAVWSAGRRGLVAVPCSEGRGACWAVVGERFRFILFGPYPFDEQWRPALACLLFVALYAVSAIRACWRTWLLGLWAAVPAAAIVLLRGALPGMSDVPADQWGGLPLTFLLSTVAFAAAIPCAVALALGRRSQMPVIRGLSIAYIELVRGVPVITFLFMAAVMFPLFVPQTFVLDKLASPNRPGDGDGRLSG
jgi:general L-amino acid transport system permease protein